MTVPGSSGSYDLIVVGAGIVGLAHAYTAAIKGLRVCVIERDAACGSASIRNFGFITVTGQDSGDSWRRARHSRDVWAGIAPKAKIGILHGGLNLVLRRPEALSVVEAFMQSDMAAGCAVWTPAEARARAPELRVDGTQGVFHSPHELRIEARVAIGQLSAWLAEHHGVQFRFGETVWEIQAPAVRTSRGLLHGERVAVCANADIGHIYPDWLARHGAQLCQLQMLRVRPRRGLHLASAVMTDLSLLRYGGYSAAPAARQLRERLAVEDPASLENGVHLVVVQSADGSLVVGDSHHYGADTSPFAIQGVDELILGHLRQALCIDDLDVVERWLGVYPSSPARQCVIDAPDDATRVVVVTSGAGMSLGFGVAADVLASW